MSKKTKKTANTRALSDSVLALVSTVAQCGLNAAASYSASVNAVLAIVKATRPGSPRNRALEAAYLGYQAGYVANSLLADPAYAKKWGNLSPTQLIEEGTEILGRGAPTSIRDDRRTEQEHKACRAASVSLVRVKERAGLKDDTKRKASRKPRPSANPPEPPRDLIAASPKFVNDNEARDYWRNAFAALMTTTEVNRHGKAGVKREVSHVTFLVQSIIADAKAAIEKALA